MTQERPIDEAGGAGARPDASEASTAAPATPPPSTRPRRRLRDHLAAAAAAVRMRGASAPVRVARVFDGERDGAGWFAAEHPVVVDRLVRDELVALLRTGSVVVRAARPMRDDLGGSEATVPADLRSDGTWVWSDAVAYYLERHWIAPDPELVAHLRLARPATPIDHRTWRRLSAAIRPDAWKGSPWPLD